MSNTHGKLRSLMSEVFQTNGLLITIFACVAIVISGFTLIEAPERWWIVLLLVAGVFIGVFVLINAAIVIKVLASLAVLVFTTAFSFQLGATIDPNGSGAFIWLFSTLIVYFGSLAVSYTVPSGQSRWSVLILTEFAYFVSVVLIAGAGLSLSWTAGAAAVTAIVFYFVVYRFGARSRTVSDSMPQHIHNEAIEYSVQKAAELAGLQARPVNHFDDEMHLVWGDRAYLLYPVKLEQAFGTIGRKNVQLSYKGKSINPWLRSLNFTHIPRRKARGADMLLVLVDLDNRNGAEIKTIGVTVPDSKAVVPVGMMPGKLLSSTDEPALKKALQRLDSSFMEHVDDLTPKQKKALEDFGNYEVKEEDAAK